MIIRFSLLAFVALLAGCAVGNRYAYDNVVAETAFSGTGSVAVAAHDQREYVLNGDKQPDFVGLQRGGYGNTFDVRTGAGKPLAEDMSASIVSTLNNKGFKASAVTVVHTVGAGDARKQILAGGADRSILLTIREWRSDSMMRIGLDYYLTMTVLGKDGTVLAETSLNGRKEVLGAAPVNPSNAGPMVGKAFKAKLEQMFADPAILRALGGH